MNNKRKHRNGKADLLIPALFLALLALILFSLTLGRYPVPLRQILHVILTTPLRARFNYTDVYRVVVEIVRLPRILMVTLCGMGLALSGAAMQGVFRNPLVSPEIAGVSAGASFGGVLAIMLSFSPMGIVSLAFLFGLIALVAAFSLARLARRSGILASSFQASSWVPSSVLSSGSASTWPTPRRKLPSIVYWLLGSFVGATYQKLAIVAGMMLFAGTLLIMLRWRINLLSLGDVDAATLGINVEVLRWGIVGLVALIVAAQVSVSGGVGWVGLIMPHLARMIVGPEHTKLLPASAFLGGIYLLGMDDIAGA